MNTKELTEFIRVLKLGGTGHPEFVQAVLLEEILHLRIQLKIQNDQVLSAEEFRLWSAYRTAAAPTPEAVP